MGRSATPAERIEAALLAADAAIPGASTVNWLAWVADEANCGQDEVIRFLTRRANRKKEPS